jgi:hypothetical protein
MKNEKKFRYKFSSRAVLFLSCTILISASIFIAKNLNDHILENEHFYVFLSVLFIFGSILSSVGLAIKYAPLIFSNRGVSRNVFGVQVGYVPFNDDTYYEVHHFPDELGSMAEYIVIRNLDCRLRVERSLQDYHEFKKLLAMQKIKRLEIKA